MGVVDFVIHNDGDGIARTSFWQTLPAEMGYPHLSVKDDVFRLLLPDPVALAESGAMNATRARIEIVDAVKQGYIHLVFDDGMPGLGYLTIRATQCVPAEMPETALGRWVTLIAYAQDGEEGVEEFGRWPAIIGRSRGIEPSVNRIPPVPDAPPVAH